MLPFYTKEWLRLVFGTIFLKKLIFLFFDLKLNLTLVKILFCGLEKDRGFEFEIRFSLRQPINQYIISPDDAIFEVEATQTSFKNFI